MFEHFEVTMKPFNRKRTVRVYLPNDYYENEDKAYPVLYMHDGQNLFRDEDAGYGVCWGIADYLDQSEIEVIVVGIDCNTEGFKRLDEYSPWKSTTMSKIFPMFSEEIGGEGQQYIDYIVNELKPMIDEKYRTKQAETAMAGSSMGGLISTYAACAYPTIFKKVASVSSAYWFNQEEIEHFIRESDLSSIEKFYMDIGTKEATETIDGERYVQSSRDIYAILKDKVSDCQFEIIEDALHNEDAWRKRVPEIFRYLFS
ncbi:MAG: alpha/beta hydrolase [Anaerobacillus sp.]|uniref:alpha/beta hydrolase n=1 Tax=Anaerobacillus sp. TaxID=1872506 RepID=UPI00391A36ED